MSNLLRFSLDRKMSLHYPIKAELIQATEIISFSTKSG